MNATIHLHCKCGNNELRINEATDGTDFAEFTVASLWAMLEVKHQHKQDGCNRKPDAIWVDWDNGSRTNLDLEHGGIHDVPF